MCIRDRNKIGHKTKHPDFPRVNPAGARIRRFVSGVLHQRGLMRKLLPASRVSYLKICPAGGR
eukprot:3132354-Prorocentrum_lima.AAC.1